MEQLYYDTSSPASFGGVHNLAKYSKTPKPDVRHWLSSQDAYTLHKPVRSKFPRRKTFVVSINYLFQIDLADVTKLEMYNDRNRFLLTCIDCLSRYAFAIPVRNKTALEVKNAFARILDMSPYGLPPVYVQSDKGKEFLNSLFLSYLKENNIKHYTSENSQVKCALVERWNRTLKSRMWRYFTYAKTYRYIDVLQDLIDSYNTTFHSTIKMAPVEVNENNQSQLVHRIYGKNKTIKKIKWKYGVGDTVRISKAGKEYLFDKGYEQKWSKEIFSIKSRHPTDPPTYEIEDYTGEIIKGRFYEQELQKVQKEKDIFEIEKILKTRKARSGKKEYLVRWVGYSPKFDSWVKDIIDITPHG